MMQSEKKTYFNTRDFKNEKTISRIIDEELPEFCREYFIGIDARTTALTRLNYAGDLKVFFRYLVTETNDYLGRNVQTLSLTDLENISSLDIQAYLKYLSFYTDENDNVLSNSDKSKARKLSALRSMCKFFIKNEKMTRDPTASTELPKIREKEIIRLEGDEISAMIGETEKLDGMSERQRKYNQNTQIRDTAIVTLFLGTGIRVSELVGLDMNDVDFERSTFVITRKGGNRVSLYFSEEVGGALYEYYLMRKNDKSIPKTENAMFISLQKKRITTRAVENLIKKYSRIVSPLKKITPHKLRSTYGTQLYRQTGDIYIVADVLGHKDVNTTKKHYAAISEDIRKEAATKVVLRKNDD